MWHEDGGPWHGDPFHRRTDDNVSYVDCCWIERSTAAYCNRSGVMHAFLVSM